MTLATADWISVAGNVLLFVLVFSMSATVDIGCMQTQIRNKKALAVGCVAQFLILPLLGFLTVKLLQLPYSLGLMLLVVTSSPGGSYSNWWCSMFNADLALSVTMTAISTVLSTFMLPLNLLLYTKISYDADVLQNIDWMSLFYALLNVMSAIGCGLFCSYHFHSRFFNKIANKCGNSAGVCLIIFSAIISNSGSDSDTKIWSRDWTFYIAVAIPAIGGLVLASILATYCNLPPPERVTVAIEACYQNVGIATSLALTMFDDPNEVSEAIGVPFFYGTIEAILVGIYCVICWKIGWTKAPADAPIWTVIMTSYEVLEQELKDLHSIEIEVTDTNKDRTTRSMDGSNRTVEESSSDDGGTFTTYFDLSYLDLSYIANELLDPQPDPYLMQQEQQQQQQSSSDTNEAANYRNLEMEQQEQPNNPTNNNGIIATSLYNLSYIKNEILNPLPDPSQHYHLNTDDRTINSNKTKSDYV